METPPHLPHSEPSEAEEGGISIDFRRILETLKKYFWIVLLFLVIGVIGAVAYLNVATPIYESTAMLKVEQRVIDAAPLTDSSRMLDSGFDDLRTLEMLSTIQRSFLSRSLMEQIVKNLKLATRPGFLPKNVPADQRDYEAAKLLMEGVSAQVVRGTRLIALSFEHPNADTATEVTEALIREYQVLDTDQRLRAASGTLDYLQREKARIEKQLSESEEKLSSYTRKLGNVSVDQELNIIADQLRELNNQLTGAKTVRLKLQADYDQVNRLRDDPQALLQIASVAALPEIQTVKSQLNDIDGQIGRMKQRYGSQSPQIAELNNQREGLQKALYAEALRAPTTLDITLRAATQTEKAIEQETKAQEQKTIETKDLAIRSSVMERQIEADKVSFAAVLQRLNEEQSQARSQPIFLQVVDPPSGGIQVRPRPLLVSAVALFAALALSAGTIFLLTVMDTSLKSVEETEQLLGVPVLAAIPSMGKPVDPGKKSKSKAAAPQKTRIPLLEDQHSIVSESFRTLRSSLFLSNRERHRVLMTSAVPGEGKSFCSINLAVALAQQGIATILIDLDLRKPVIEGRLFGQKGGLGVTDFLMGKADFEQILRPSEVPNLFVITAGRHYSNPAELLLRHERLRELLDYVDKRFARVIVDSAPLLAVSDTLNIARNFDAVCLAIHSHRTARRLSRRAAGLLARANRPLTGIILNLVPATASSYYYYYRAYGDRAYGAQPATASASA